MVAKTELIGQDLAIAYPPHGILPHALGNNGLLFVPPSPPITNIVVSSSARLCQPRRRSRVPASVATLASPYPTTLVPPSPSSNPQFPSRVPAALVTAPSARRPHRPSLAIPTPNASACKGSGSLVWLATQWLLLSYVPPVASPSPHLPTHTSQVDRLQRRGHIPGSYALQACLFVPCNVNDIDGRLATQIRAKRFSLANAAQILATRTRKRPRPTHPRPGVTFPATRAACSPIVGYQASKRPTQSRQRLERRAPNAFIRATRRQQRPSTTSHPHLHCPHRIPTAPFAFTVSSTPFLPPVTPALPSSLSRPLPPRRPTPPPLLLHRYRRHRAFGSSRPHFCRPTSPLHLSAIPHPVSPCRVPSHIFQSSHVPLASAVRLMPPVSLLFCWPYALTFQCLFSNVHGVRSASRRIPTVFPESARATSQPRIG
ncbi:hypothetical protein BOTBODRAFT_174018 [Botryobasidium botryosum FD-172 SS1]|uniref:Uncharacterized protein n=1 Tax=Botryobasidium botryosum (strain FD-172 SS1) TaxID=930990 RepID=A0A067MKB3_BOTB1|nr:hypothetical protein BOTBODRAFT_174018 [Botryobasidium botryosum FD-172 SS1]